MSRWMSRIRAAAAGALVVCILPALANADLLITKNGKVIRGKVTEKDANTYHVKLATVEFDLSKELVKEVLIEGDMSSYVPKNDKEKDNLAKGFVLYKSQWISKDQYAKEIEKENAKRNAVMEEEMKHLQFADGWKFTTKHFAFQGNCPKEILDDLAALLEEYYGVMQSQIQLQASPGLLRKKMAVNVYRDQEDYYRAGGAPGGTGGYFSPVQESLNFFYDFEDFAVSKHVLLHEGTHLLTYLANPNFFGPAWINEGMAEYFGSSKVTGERGKRKMEPGQIIDSRLLVLQEMEKDRYIPIDKWLPYSSNYGTVQTAGGNVYEHYAYWWAFCHFLAKSPKYGKKFFGYFKDLYSLNGFEKTSEYSGLYNQSGVVFLVKPEEYTAKLLSKLGVKDIKVLDGEFRAWIKEQKPAGVRGYFIVGRDLCGDRKYDEALVNLNKAIEKGYVTAECYAYRARVWEGKGQIEKANEDWLKAIEQNPVETSYRLELAFNYRVGKKREEALKQVRVAREIDPYDTNVRAALEKMESKDP